MSKDGGKAAAAEVGSVGKLVLTRKAGERVRIRHKGGELWLDVTRIGDQRVRLAFDASTEWEIHREEMVAVAEKLPG